MESMIEFLDLPKTVKNDLARSNLKFRELLGSGQFGDVLEVEFLEDRSRHALKYMKGPVKAGELMLWPVLDHPNVVPVEAIFTILDETPRHMFMMPKVDRRLSDALHEEGFHSSPEAFDRARGWTRDVVSGVAHMHRLGLAHMDLKASNVLVTPAGRAMVADFTYVCPASNPAASWGTQTPLAPPEACWSFGEPLVDPKDFDVWTLGTFALNGVFPGRQAVLEKRLGPVSCGDAVDDRPRLRWHRDAYPRLAHLLQPREFALRMASTFAASRPSEDDVDAARNFVVGLLHVDPGMRATASQALEHRLLGGHLSFFPTDRAWSRHLKEEDHRLAVEELRARLSSQRPVEDGRLTEYQGRARRVTLDAEEGSPDAPAPEHVWATSRGSAPPEGGRGRESAGCGGTPTASSYSPGLIQALISDADDFLTRCRSVGRAPPTPRGSDAGETATAAPRPPLVEGEAAQRTKRRRIRVWAAAVRRLFRCCLGDHAVD